MQNRDLTAREIWIYAAIGFSVWLNGAVTFRLGGAFLFQSSAAVTVLVAVFVAVAVCLIFRSTMRWRGTREDQALNVAVIMALPGLFGEAARETVFTWATGLDIGTMPRFVATMFFGNAVLFAYGAIRMYRARGH